MFEASIDACQSSGDLNFATAQKIIHQLLTCKRISTALGDEKVAGLVRAANHQK